MKTLISNRLILRSFKLEDSKDMFDYAKRMDVGPKAGWKPHADEAESKAIIERFIAKDDVYAIVYKENMKMIGSIGIHSTVLASLGSVYEIGYVLHPEYHRMGIMSEAVHKVLDYAFVDLNQDEVYVGHFTDNIASQKLIEKLGFEYVEDIYYKSIDYGEKESKIYRLTKLDYVLKMEEK